MLILFIDDSKAALPASTMFLPSHLGDHSLSLGLIVLPRHPLPHINSLYTSLYLIVA